MESKKQNFKCLTSKSHRRFNS